jgi:hypothetical protein
LALTMRDDVGMTSLECSVGRNGRKSSTRMRQASYPFHFLLVKAIGQALLIVSQYANPVAIAAIGWKYWLFFMGMLILFLVMVYFTYPETKGLTHKELASLFENEAGVDMMEKMEGIELDIEIVPVAAEKKE